MSAAEPTSSTIPILLLVLPLFTALVILIGHKVLKGACVILSVASAVICFLASLSMLGVMDANPIMLPFLDIPGHFGAGNNGFHLAFDALIDTQSKGMMFIVTAIGLAVHVFSLGYMKEDAGKIRYFGALSLFMFSMTGIVLAGNLIMMFVFWELVGLSSYLLIGHWFEKASAAEASKKAFLTNRIGDFGFMIGILMLFMANHGNVQLYFDANDGLKHAFTEGALHQMAASQSTYLTIAALALFMGAVGKSAQLPLHVWLPDAMEGPTPVSALIHAATMVAAGVYMLVSCSFVIEASPTAGLVIAWTGGLTALFAALMATQQNDIKRVLAYSTLSQLGYMVMAVGLLAIHVSRNEAAGAGHPAMFHLYTHAFFKAMLFLGAGAVIYSCHHEQDMWKMGGLAKHMPVTFCTFAIGTCALMGVPGFSGYFSKEAILGVAFEQQHSNLLFWVGITTAALTAFYMTRLVVVAFFGKPRTDAAHHAVEAPLVMVLPLIVLAFATLVSPLDFVTGAFHAMKPVEAGDHMTVKIIAGFALALGAVGGFFLYRGKDKDPLNIKLFANKFYVDEVYVWVVKIFQDGLAWLVTGLERVFVDGIVVRLPAWIAAKAGSTARGLQSGHLQAYTFLFGLGVLMVIYLVVFVLPVAGH